MSDKKNVGRKALDENNLENVSGGYVYQKGDKWIAHKDSIPWASIHPAPKGTEGYHKEFDTEEEALKYDFAHGGKGRATRWDFKF